MSIKKMSASKWIAAAALAVAAGSFAIADTSKEAKPSAQTEIKLPPGWTEADMQKCMVAATPGKMHERLAQGAGVWIGKCSMWMGAGAEPVATECTLTNTLIMDGRYVKSEMGGDMPGMGAFNGLGFYAYDNVAKKFVSTWMDNHSTGLMSGTGELSADGKTLTWTYQTLCPLNDQAITLRDVETVTGPDSRKFESYGPDPKTGKVYKMISVELTRKK